MAPERDSYPYGRKTDSTNLVVHNSSIVVQDDTGFPGDDEGFFTTENEREFFVLYEAPRSDDKARGHLSIWVQFRGNEYTNAYTLTGDDGMVYEKFTDLEEIDSVSNYVNEEDIETLMR